MESKNSAIESEWEEKKNMENANMLRFISTHRLVCANKVFMVIIIHQTFGKNGFVSHSWIHNILPSFLRDSNAQLNRTRASWGLDKHLTCSVAWMNFFSSSIFNLIELPKKIFSINKRSESFRSFSMAFKRDLLIFKWRFAFLLSNWWRIKFIVFFVVVRPFFIRENSKRKLFFWIN